MIGLVCIPPWIFGSVDARPKLVLAVAIVAIALLSLWLGVRSGRWERWRVQVPGLVLASLALFALWQATPMGTSLVKAFAPATSSLRDSLAPAQPERVIGDTGALVPLPSATISLSPDMTLDMAAGLAILTLLYQATVAGPGGYLALRRLTIALAVNATIMALFALFQSMTWTGKIYGIRPSPWQTGGPFVCHNHLAAYLNMGLGAALGLLISRSRTADENEKEARGGRSRREVSRGRWLGYAYASGVIVAGVLGSHSRGGFLAMIAAAILFALAFRSKSIRPTASLSVAAGLLVLFLWAVGSASPFQRLATIPGTFAEGMRGEDEGLGLRVEVWGAAVASWRASPILGWGFGCFAPATASRFRHDRGTFYSHAENEYLQLLVETGVVGLVVALAGVAALAVLMRSAFRGAPSAGDRAVVTGASFGVFAVLTQAAGDFPLHIPGVIVPLTILVGSVCRLGFVAQGTPFVSTAPWARYAGCALTAIVILVFGPFALTRGYASARAETAIVTGGLPTPGAFMPSADLNLVPKDELEATRGALSLALAAKPDWAEGHLRHGLTLLGLYRQAAAEWVREIDRDPLRAAIISDPLWLYGIAHGATAESLKGAGGITDHEPVRLYLAPAARSFLEARRCCPTYALAHVELASLDYLLEGGDPVSSYVSRAERLAGADGKILELAGSIAIQAGQDRLATECWRRSLETTDAHWKLIAHVARETLPPTRVLAEVVPRDPKYALRFADLIYAGPDDGEARRLFHQAALEWLQADPPGPERLWLEGRTKAGLDDKEGAREAMSAAIAADPGRSAWREDYVGWLIRWGDPKEAHRQALIGTRLDPENPRLRDAAGESVEALYPKGAP